MIRFPNPGSTIDNMLHIYKVLYKNLIDNGPFSLDDMSQAMVKALLASSSGQIGEQALSASTREDRSRDPLYNQSKMYAEIFRALGWVSSNDGSALSFGFSLLGKYAAESENIRPLFEESILGIVYPNDVLETKNGIESRPFVSILSAIEKLNGYIYRDEMIIGPMSYGDQIGKLASTLEEILMIRPNFERLQKRLSDASKSLGIQENTMQNYTRFPISVLEYCGWVTKERVKGIYSKSLVMMKITEKGKETLNAVRSMTDIRKAEFESRNARLQKALANMGFYGMLDRSGYDVDKIRDMINGYREQLTANGISGNVLFSPYQTIKKSVADNLLDQRDSIVSTMRSTHITSAASSQTRKSIEVSEVQIVYGQHASFSNNQFVDEIIELLKEKSVEETIEKLFIKYSTSRKEIFYSLIGYCFSILGFNCKVSRAGVNYERFDAIIVDEKKSIPIEIKSPMEEEHLSIKGVRQAIENKIMLLSRKAYVETYPTDAESSSLVVCYKLPNSRSDVLDLINAAKKVFGISIGIIDFKSLLIMVVNSIAGSGAIDKKQIRKLEGLIDVRFVKT